MKTTLQSRGNRISSHSYLPAFLPRRDRLNSLVTDFSAVLRRHLDPSVSIQNPGVIDLNGKRIPLEILISGPLGRIGIVVSTGVSVIHENMTRDRIAALAGSGAFDGVYRLRTTDLYYHATDAAALLSRLSPRFFSESGLFSLAEKATSGVYDLSPDVSLGRWILEYSGMTGDLPSALSVPTQSSSQHVIPALRLEYFDEKKVRNWRSLHVAKAIRKTPLAA